MSKGRPHIWRWVFPGAAIVLFAFGCSRGTGGVDRPASPASSSPTNPEAGSAREGKAFPVLGVDVNWEEVPIQNGQRVSLRDGLFVEVFVVPYPPAPETDVHLFLFKGEKIIRGAQIIVTYDMEDMDHGARDRQIGREIEDGHYAIALDLFMWGNWVADAAISHPEFDNKFRMLLSVYPRKGKRP